MSSRALRRLEKQKELATEVESKEEEPYAPVKKSNLYALIGEEEEEEEEESQNEKEKARSEPLKVLLPTKSQKKKKKKPKKKAIEPKPSSDDELDTILKELNDKEGKFKLTEEGDSKQNITYAELDPSFRYFTASKQAKSAKLLSIDVKDLDPDNEFKKLFGKLSAEAIEDADSTTSTSIPPEQLAQIKKLSKVIRGWGGRDRRSIPGTTRKLVLTKIRDDWIPTQKKDITMEELTIKELIQDKLAESDDWVDVIKDDINGLVNHGIKFYKFERIATTETKVANSQFFASVVLSPNHENLMTLLPRFPYHVETILQVALILIRQGDKSNSNGLVERALFAFDRAFKQNFDISNGLTRLPFNYYLNRVFYLTAFRYIEVLTKKGTYFTALTYCKLLLALSPSEDPLGARYFIDFYAILAGEYYYLIDLVKSPLITTYAKWFTPGIAYSTVLARLRINDNRGAKIALKKAFEIHPYVGYKLLEAIGLSDDIPVKDYSVFEVGQETELSTEAYLIRAPILWNDALERKYLHDELLDLINTGIKFTPIKDGIIPLNFLRFAILSGEGKIMAKIPAEIWKDDIFEYDVLPPKSDNVTTLHNSIDERFLERIGREDEMLEMAQRLSLQDLVENGVQIDE